MYGALPPIRDVRDIGLQLEPGFSVYTSELSAILVDALENSAQLLVICSANARESKWVALELGWFLKNRGPQNVLLAVSEGSEREPRVFPPLALEYELDKKPWYDFRGFQFPDAKGRLFDDERDKSELVVWHLPGEKVAQRVAHQSAVVDLVFDRHKPVLFTANTDGYVTCWNLEQDLANPLFERQVVRGPIRRITLSPRCDYVVAATGSPKFVHFGRSPSFLLSVTGSDRSGLEERICNFFAAADKGRIRIKLNV